MTCLSRITFFSLLAVLAVAVVSPALGADDSLLTVDRIYKGSDLKAKRYSARWLDEDNGYVRMEASKDPSGGRDIVRYDPATGETEILVPAGDFVPDLRSGPLKVESYWWSADRSKLLIYTNSKRVWRKNSRGDYWVLDRSSHELRKLGGDAKESSLMFAKFAPDGLRVGYVRENDIYVEDLRDGTIRRLTTKPNDKIINGTFDWVYEEELQVRDGFRWSPDSRQIAYWQLDTALVREFPLVDYTSGIYPKIKKFAYPKVGEKNSACRVGIVAAEGGETRWLKIPGDPRNHYIARMDWTPDGREIMLQQLNRLQNTNHVMLFAAEGDEMRTALIETDKAWVHAIDDVERFDDGHRFTWISERDGWRHVYIASARGGSPELLTPGEYDVIDVLRLDERQGLLYFIASPENPTQRYLYSVPLAGGKPQRITPKKQNGSHSYSISPDARWAIHTYSSFDVPPTVELISLPDHRSVRMLEDNKTLKKKLKKLRRQPTEFFRVDIGDGISCDAYCIRPPKLKKRKKYPLLIYVYGEPAGTTVRDRWGGSGYLWHLMMAQQGYVVMSIDNRGTNAPRGREWRKCIYRKVGIIAPQDQAAAIKAILKERKYLDPKRVGIWGWSGGGSMTLNAMFKYPDLYHTGVSIASVPNQRFYDTIYQERYMGLPKDNVEGFRKGSPINYAAQLKGNLLVIHGTGDDNCHYAGAVSLIDELIRHNRPFSMMAYPNRTHSIREGTNTTLHLRTLMTDYFKANLPSGPRR